jgi:hypothetical protein
MHGVLEDHYDVVQSRFDDAVAGRLELPFPSPVWCQHDRGGVGCHLFRVGFDRHVIGCRLGVIVGLLQLPLGIGVVLRPFQHGLVGRQLAGIVIPFVLLAELVEVAEAQDALHVPGVHEDVGDRVGRMVRVGVQIVIDQHAVGRAAGLVGVAQGAVYRGVSRLV